MESSEIGSVYVFCLELALSGILFKFIVCNLVRGQKIVVKIKHKFYIAAWSQPYPPLKNSGCAKYLHIISFFFKGEAHAQCRSDL